ncbi:hypothetical protein BDF22DRAFT_678310 [Syncephalis plumigaleata]|nr:hypothetical protein BDF22DRAFT_678310 [Syncephalis plumigaleata]
MATRPTLEENTTEELGPRSLDKALKERVPFGELAADAVERRETLSIKPRRGLITANESYRLLRILESFSQEHDMSAADLPVTEQQYQGLWSRLFLACPDRTTATIARHLRHILDEELHARKWTKKEERRLMRCFLVTIYLSIYHLFVIGAWSLVEKRRLAHKVVEHIQKNHGDVKEFLRLRLEDSYSVIRWHEISQHFPHRDAWQCRYAWRTMVHIVYNNPNGVIHRMTAERFNIEDDRQLLSILYNSGVERDDEIGWTRVARDMNFKYHVSVLTQRFAQLKRSITNYQWKTWDEILDELIMLNNRAIQQQKGKWLDIIESAQTT